MPLFFLLIFLHFSTARSALPELFGAGASSMALGNQADRESADNNYYAAALLGFSRSTQYSFNSFYLDTDFHRINDVVVENHTNTINRYERGTPEVNPTPTMMLAAHLSTPLFTPEGLRLNASLFAPYDRTMEADTNEAYQPSYAMYDTRILRTTLLFSLAQSFGSWSYSFGGHSGFQSNGESYFMTRTTTTDKPSLGKVRFNAKPALSLTASVARRHEKGFTYLAFQEEMKARLINRANGETEIAGNASLPFDLDAVSVLYYDPMIVRLGHQFFTERWDLFTSLEYQRWESFETSMLKLNQRSGQINGTKDYERLRLRNIFIPKLGLQRRWNDRLSYRLGYFYRPTPIKTSGLRGAGNTIDVNKHVVTVGGNYLIPFQSKLLNLSLAYQAHFLGSERVTKTPHREDGTPGQNKIGSPGYRVGGMVHALSLGLSWKI